MRAFYKGRPYLDGGLFGGGLFGGGLFVGGLFAGGLFPGRPFWSYPYQSYINHKCTKYCLYPTNILPIYNQNQGYLSVIFIWGKPFFIAPLGQANLNTF